MTWTEVATTAPAADTELDVWHGVLRERYNKMTLNGGTWTGTGQPSFPEAEITYWMTPPTDPVAPAVTIPTWSAPIAYNGTGQPIAGHLLTRVRRGAQTAIDPEERAAYLWNWDTKDPVSVISEYQFLDT